MYKIIVKCVCCRNEDDEWVAGPLEGRVVEVREPTNAQEVSHFLTLTITQAS